MPVITLAENCVPENSGWIICANQTQNLTTGQNSPTEDPVLEVLGCLDKSDEVVFGATDAKLHPPEQSPRRCLFPLPLPHSTSQVVHFLVLVGYLLRNRQLSTALLKGQP
uniref:Uncharacterized protein n=1 Tax=Mesocestoides corti TaxID=53468 RepID=A0A5K3G2Z5_MESCO